MYCKSCGKESADNAIFCASCGEGISSQATKFSPTPASGDAELASNGRRLGCLSSGYRHSSTYH